VLSEKRKMMLIDIINNEYLKEKALLKDKFFNNSDTSDSETNMIGRQNIFYTFFFEISKNLILSMLFSDSMSNILLND
jgi:hypothetical protein